jgi:hypothetical protein
LKGIVDERFFVFKVQSRTWECEGERREREVGETYPAGFGRAMFFTNFKKRRIY